jgi:hypothetical protein
MAGLVPAIHVFSCFESRRKKDVDARHKAVHDEVRSYTIAFDGRDPSAQDTCNGTGFAHLIGTGGERNPRQPQHGWRIFDGQRCSDICSAACWPPFP